MASPNRIGQINQEILRVLSDRIANMKDPRVAGLVSVVRVDTSGDLSLCRVYVSRMGAGTEYIKGLKSATGYLRRELSAALSLRHTPALEFVPDESIRRGAEVLDMLRQVAPKNEKEDGGEAQP